MPDRGFPVEAVTRIRSRDGTSIAFVTNGGGPGVLVVPGVLSQAKDYAAFATALGQTFTVHTIERRGRGQSGPQGPRYGRDRECEDLAAVQEATGAQLLFGHSYGGLIALESAKEGAAFSKVAVYEPGVSIDGSISIAWIADYRRALKQGRPLDAFAQFCVASGPTSARRLPVWMMKALLPRFIPRRALEEKFALLSENAREHEVIGGLDNACADYRSIRAEVLLMVGAKSNLPWLPMAVTSLASAIPHLAIERFSKLDHFGPDISGPRDVAARVQSFFHAPRPEATFQP